MTDIVDRLRSVTLFQSYDYNLALNNEAAATIETLVRERDEARAALANQSCARGQRDGNTQFCAIAVDAIRERDEARAENKGLRGLLWYAWSEFNAISARSGAPLTHDRMTTCDEAWWTTMRDAFALAIGPDALKPWPSPEARAALNPEKTDD